MRIWNGNSLHCQTPAMEENKFTSFLAGPSQLLSAKVVRNIVSAARIASRIEPPDVNFFVQLKPFSFRFVWVVVATTHILCIGCFGIQSWVYKLLPTSRLAYSLALYDVIMPVSNYRVVSIVYGIVAIAHCLLLLHMLVASIWHRRFAFGFAISRQSRDNSTMTAVMRNVHLVIGFFGVQGRHFGVIYVMREIFETILQSIQAYRMSQFVPRLLVNRFFVLTIVINCWSTPILKYKLKHNPPLERLFCLLFDIALDFTSVVGVPVVLALPYWKQYDFAGTDFPYDLYWNDFWFVSMINELRIVFVSSWKNLASELIFSLSLLVCLQDAKDLLHQSSALKPSNRNCLRFRNAIAPIGSPTEDILLKNETNRLSLEPIAGKIIPAKPQRDSSEHFKNISEQKRVSFRFVRIVHLFLVLWGIMLLILHFSASAVSNTRHCAQQTWPWLGSKGGCMFLRIRCDEVTGNTGNYTEVDAAMAGLDEQTLSYIVIRHCPYVEIPSRIQEFPNIVGLKIYNSTIVRWDSDAAISSRFHSKMVFLFMAKTNMTQIPEGLLSRDFPPKISDIEFAWTNLTALPDNLSDIWPQDGFIMFERSLLPSVPATLLKKTIPQISLAGGVISELPETVFTNPIGNNIWVSGNPIETLPETLVPSQSIAYMDFCYTQLQKLPSWVNAELLPHIEIVAGGTPLCDTLKPAIASGDNSTLPPDLAIAWAAHRAGIFSCWTDYPYFYPYEAEVQQ